MTRKLTIEVSEKVAAGAEAEAERQGTDISGVIEEALVRDLGWRAVARIQDRNADLDEETATTLAYDELRAYRRERDSA